MATAATIMADPVGKGVAERLFCVTKHAAREGFFRSLRALAKDLYLNNPPEFRYTRLEKNHTMSIEGIMGYVSLARDIELLKELDDHVQPFCGATKPTWTGFENFLYEKAVQYLQRLGFDQNATSKQCRSMLKRDPPDIPTWRKIFVNLDIHISERKFNRLVSLAGVKQKIGYQIVTKQIFLPAGAII